MNTSDMIHPFNIETVQIARELNSTIASATWGTVDMVCITLHNGITFGIYYKSGVDFGYIYVRFNGNSYNYSLLFIRDVMFDDMRAWLKERKQNADNGEDSGF